MHPVALPGGMQEYVPADIHVPPGEEGRTDRFRVYRNLGAIPHVNLYGTTNERLFSVYRDGYGEELQATVDGLSTGDCVVATILGDPDDPDEAWRLVRAIRDDTLSTSVAFAPGVDPERLPAPVTEDSALRERAAVEPVGRVLEHEGQPVGEVWCQPRDPLPHDAFLLNVLVGQVPMESHLDGLPKIEALPAEVLVLDTATPSDTSYDLPFGVFVFLTEAGEALGDELRERYGLPLDRDADTRPDVDPY
jgi:hypothetical protein